MVPHAVQPVHSQASGTLYAMCYDRALGKALFRGRDDAFSSERKLSPESLISRMAVRR